MSRLTREKSDFLGLLWEIKVVTPRSITEGLRRRETNLLSELRHKVWHVAQAMSS